MFPSIMAGGSQFRVRVDDEEETTLNSRGDDVAA